MRVHDGIVLLENLYFQYAKKKLKSFQVLNSSINFDLSAKGLSSYQIYC